MFRPPSASMPPTSAVTDPHRSSSVAHLAALLAVVSVACVLGDEGAAQAQVAAGQAQPTGAPAPTPPAPAPSVPGAVTSTPPPGNGGGEPRRETSFGRWFANQPATWIGATVAGTGAAMGIVFGALAQSASSDAQAQSAAILAAYQKTPGANLSQRADLCGGSHPPSQYAAACANWQTNNNHYQTNTAIAAFGWAAFGLAVIGVAGYSYSAWNEEKKSGGVAVLPLVTPSDLGVALSGSF